ncbi:hypothetical protein [Pseudomonas sp. NA-150]|uniref:hypothetical protein n=1 Tax=Pseudomonas sp. NA-150 TaxID=3367525 RepID=UPI0037C7D3A0
MIKVDTHIGVWRNAVGAVPADERQRSSKGFAVGLFAPTRQTVIKQKYFAH